jgi:hypothetical protein
VETVIEGLTDADELAVLASIPASEAALPVPLALAPVPDPELLASPEPSANALVVAVRAVVSTEPSESASMCDVADAEPSPTELAETSTLADEDAFAVPSVPVLVSELAVSAEAAPLIEPPPRVETEMVASAKDADDADVSSAVVDVPASAEAVPWASPSPAEAPVRLAEAVEPSSVAEVALAEPEAVAPVPAVTRSTEAFTVPSLANEAPVLPSAVDESVVSAAPVASAWVVEEESATLPAVPSL